MSNGVLILKMGRDLIYIFNIYTVPSTLCASYNTHNEWIPMNNMLFGCTIIKAMDIIWKWCVRLVHFGMASKNGKLEYLSPRWMR